MCFLLALEGEVKVSSIYGFHLTFNDSLPQEDIPRKINIFPVATNTWYGIINGEWPYKENLYIQKVELDLDPKTVTEIGISEKDVQFRVQSNDQQSFEDCILQILWDENNSSSSPPCFPILFNFANIMQKLPACQTNADAGVEIDKIWSTKKEEYIKCLKPKIAKLYDTSVYRTRRPEQEAGKKSVNFVFYGASNLRKIEEEVLVISPTAFIGSIGGSMGLFFGFSALACFSDLLDQLFSKLCPSAM